MQVNVLLFASAAQAVGQRSISIDVPEAVDLDAVRAAVLARYPQLQSIVAISQWAVDHQLVPLTTQISGNQAIALIPPVSGG